VKRLRKFFEDYSTKGSASMKLPKSRVMSETSEVSSAEWNFRSHWCWRKDF